MWGQRKGLWEGSCGLASPFCLKSPPLPCLFHSVVTQEPSMTVSPGGTVILTHGFSTGALTNGHYPHWLQQKYGQVPGHRFIIQIINTPGPPPFLGGKAALTLSSAQPVDKADYHSRLHYSGAC
uniref:Immunoglobulin V-set domain-containing protein n=1 Tax=Suricata suricatta TaxID=37032 RepID=A0A673V902_SURSU